MQRSINNLSLLVILCALRLVAPSAHAQSQATFQGLGVLPEVDVPWSKATAVNGDGTVVVGFSGTYKPFRWTEQTGMQALPLLPSATNS